MRISDWSSDVCSSDLAALVHQRMRRKRGSHPGPGDSRTPCSAIGLQHVAIQMQRTLAQCLQIKYGAQAAANQALDFLGTPALFATRRLAVTACMRGPG